MKQRSFARFSGQSLTPLRMLDRLSKDLQSDFADVKGFPPRNLKYMRAFVVAYPDPAFLQQVVAQIHGDTTFAFSTTVWLGR